MSEDNPRVKYEGKYQSEAKDNYQSEAKGKYQSEDN